MYGGDGVEEGLCLGGWVGGRVWFLLDNIYYVE